MTVGRVLILDGHTNQALACARSLGHAGHAVTVASHWRWPLAGWSRYSGSRFHLTGQTLEAFAEMRGWAARHGVKMVLPLTERSCILCNTERQQWEAAGIHVGCGPEEMLAAAFDKAQTLQLAGACGVRIPSTCCPTSLDECQRAARDVGFPCVIKPRFSNAWNGAAFLPDRGCAYVNSVEALSEAVLARRQDDFWPLIQGYVAGSGKGVFALCDHGRVVAWFAHERLRDVQPTGSGSSLRRSMRLEARLREPSERLLSEMQWHGPAMVEFRDDGINPPCLMEVNGRFWNSLQLAVDAGIDFPRLWAEVLDGKTPESLTDYREGVTLRWLWGDVKRFLHILAGPPPGYTGSFPTLRQGMRELFGRQPSGTRLEIWRASDPWPAVGEWVQGIREVLA